MAEDTDIDRAPKRPPRSAYAVHPKERMPYSAPTVLPPAIDPLPADYYLQPPRHISVWAIAGVLLFILWFVYTFVLAHPAPKKPRPSVPSAAAPQKNEKTL